MTTTPNHGAVGDARKKLAEEAEREVEALRGERDHYRRRFYVLREANSALADLCPLDPREPHACTVLMAVHDVPRWHLNHMRGTERDDYVIDRNAHAAQRDARAKLADKPAPDLRSRLWTLVAELRDDAPLVSPLRISDAIADILLADPSPIRADSQHDPLSRLAAQSYSTRDTDAGRAQSAADFEAVKAALGVTR